ncbi:transcriptional regulator [Mycobacterium szulgai]|uniref:Transcriptional regulator n=2 Tax=Mycobacterium szulgai TaxID=1787 RepID=A0A1X2EE31_MYCSZ|nr:BTAD domain-containing putative transcriptional regulator [Mycobacterium szulgai]ORW98934.1 transcriptional regulator [Mycobacterium szulgai]
MTVEFRLLGDVEALVDGVRLDIGHARQRCVLAALLVDVNHPIPAEQLIDRVWSDRPPYSARGSLTSYLSRLRSLLAPVEGVTIARGPGGYALMADTSSIDLHRFREVVAEARDTEDPVAAAALFDRALMMWTGEPFASLDTPWVNDLRGALVAEQRSASLDRNDAALRAGRHAELLVELTAAQTSSPLDERLAGQLMLAQYRAGRQADALDTYRKMRQRLVDELGVEPGPSLRQVHQQILSGDGANRAAENGKSPDGSPVPQGLIFHRPRSGLLRRATSFVGHTQEVARIVDALRAGPLVTLTGVGGVGKTRLAVEVARHEQEQFSDGVSICELAPVEHGNAIGHTIAAALRLRQQARLDIEESVIEYLRSREVLLVVDNCEHVLDAAAGLLERIVQHCPGVTVLATSRQPLGVEGERIVVLPPLPVEDATRLFADRARASRPDFSLEQQPKGAVAEICRRVDCLPLGVELAAARMRVMSTLDVVRRLDGLGISRGGMRGAVPRHQSLTATIDWSYRMLTEPEQALFARLSVFAGSFDLDAAHGVCGSDDADNGLEDTLELLAGLVDKSMVIVRSVTDRTRYGVLETLRAYGRDRLQEQGIDLQLIKQHAVYFSELAERAAVGLHTAEEREWVERMLPDYDNLRTAFEHAMADNDVDLALRLVAANTELVGVRVGYELGDWAERAVAVADPDHPLFAAVVGAAARVAWVRGDFTRARRLVNLAGGRVPGRGTARVAYPEDVLADVVLFEGDASGFLAYWDKEVTRARGNDDPIRLVHTICVLATCQVVLGNPETALPAAQEAVEVADRTGNPTAQSTAYFTLAYLLKKSEPERALRLFDDAARLAGGVQNFWWYGIALMEAAATRAVHGDPVQAAGLFVEVLDHWDRVGDWAQQWLSLRHVTRLLARLGADEDAVFLHYALLKAAKPSPLHADQLALLKDRLGTDCLETYAASAADGSAAVARARSGLQRYAEDAMFAV